MPARKKIIALIPARGGSKGLPGKNIKNFAGKPLIAYTIESAKKSKLVSKVVVSTDAKDIAAVAKKYGAEVIDRPKNLATDIAPVSGAVLHSLNWLKEQGETFNLLVLLQPTSPLRTSQDIDDALKTFVKSKGDSLVSVSPVDHSPYRMFKIEKYLKPLFGQKYLKARKQDPPKVYRPNGAIYVLPATTFYKHRKFYVGRVVPYIMPLEKSIDIDSLRDFLFAELLFKQASRT